jgi:hypothetical protein
MNNSAHPLLELDLYRVNELERFAVVPLPKEGSKGSSKT